MGKLRSIPTLAVVGVWDEKSQSEDPENVKILMSTGKWVMYRIEVVQPKPQLKEQLDEFTNLCVGYERK